MLLPVLPMFLIENYGTLQSQTGVILASFTFSAMISRPFFAYFSDLYNRKTVFCLTFFIFAILFLPYPFITGGVALFVVLRSLHGFAFGGETVSGNAVLVDIVHEKRRGEGFGYFGISNNVGMAVGPMAGIYFHETFENGFLLISLVTFVLCTAGFFCLLEIHLPKKPKRTRTREDKKPSLDKFYQIKGVYAGLSLLLLSFPYGLIISFAALYGKELGIGKTGLFFVCMSVGLICSRVFSGKIIDRGKLTAAIKFAAFFLSITLALFASAGHLKIESAFTVASLFYATGFLFGLAYGMILPSFNTLFVNLSPDNRRAAASSTYLTNFDLGLGGGLILGGIVMEKGGMSAAYFVAAVAALISAVYFTLFVGAHFERNKLR
jgi:MFS family permease